MKQRICLRLQGGDTLRVNDYGDHLELWVDGRTIGSCDAGSDMTFGGRLTLEQADAVAAALTATYIE